MHQYNRLSSAKMYTIHNWSTDLAYSIGTAYVSEFPDSASHIKQYLFV